jgi:hypothetical protein
VYYRIAEVQKVDEDGNAMDVKEKIYPFEKYCLECAVYKNTSWRRTAQVIMGISAFVILFSFFI